MTEQEPAPYELPEWERAKKAAEAEVARDRQSAQLAYVETREGRMVGSEGAAMTGRTYELRGGMACR